MYRYIVGMADTKSEIGRLVAAASEQIDLHIIKLLLMPESNDANHWKQEIYSFLRNVNRLKSSKKWPEFDFLLERISCHEDIVENLRFLVEQDYPAALQSNVSNNDIIKAFQEYHHFLAAGLSSKGVIGRQDCYDVLDNIVDKYSK